MFQADEEARIVEAIREAEARTTGEIRLYVEEFCMRDHPVERASEVFALFGMHHTEARNAVLVYLASKSRHFAIWGDTGIHEKVGFQFWENEKKLLRDYLRSDLAADGLVEVIRQIGNQLQQHFPAGDHPNPNELSDDILYG